MRHGCKFETPAYLFPMLLIPRAGRLRGFDRNEQDVLIQLNSAMSALLRVPRRWRAASTAQQEVNNLEQKLFALRQARAAESGADLCVTSRTDDDVEASRQDRRCSPTWLDEATCVFPLLPCRVSLHRYHCQP